MKLRQIFYLLCTLKFAAPFRCMDFCTCNESTLKCIRLNGFSSDSEWNDSAISTIDLSGIHLESLPISFHQFTENQIRVLDISNNTIREIDWKKLPKSVENLNLSGNKITELPKNVRYFTRLRTLGLSGNPIKCDCNTIQVRDWLVKQAVVIDNPVFCAKPRQYANQTWMNVVKNDVCTDEIKEQKKKTISWDRGDQPAYNEYTDMADGSGDEEEEPKLLNPPKIQEPREIGPAIEVTHLVEEPDDSITEVTSMIVVTFVEVVVASSKVGTDRIDPAFGDVNYGFSSELDDDDEFEDNYGYIPKMQKQKQKFDTKQYERLSVRGSTGRIYMCVALYVLVFVVNVLV